jgi:hypothetical protein
MYEYFLLMMCYVPNVKNFTVLIIFLECSLLSIVLCQQFITVPFVYSTSNYTQPAKLNGPINSIQYSSDGNASWIVSGRWRIEVNFDNTGIIPIEIKNLNTTLVAIPMDGSDTQRYELSDFKQDSQSYDNKTNTSTIKGKLTMTSDDQPIENIGVILKLINKNVLTITLDPSKTRDQLGETPIYGIER